MTKSNDVDPWLGGEGEEKPKAKSAPKKADANEPEPEITTEDVTPESEATDKAAEVSDQTSESTVDDEESAALGTTEFVPSDVPERDRSRGEEPYYGGRGGSASGFTRQSEATYVPAEPKIYRAPKSADEDDEPEFGFPEVPANTQRLFVVIEIPRAAKREFTQLAGSFSPREHDRVRWMSEEAMHLTLKFLGDIPVDQIPDIEKSLQRAADSTGKFTIKIGRTGCFPSFRDPRICWVGFNGELRRLEQLQGRVEGGLVALGLDEDEREFRAHITIGRTRPGIRGRFAEDVGLSWQHAPLRTSGQSIPVNAIALYRSFLNEKEDTEYKQIANFELG